MGLIIVQTIKICANWSTVMGEEHATWRSRFEFFFSFKLLKCQLRVYCIIIDVHCITILYVAAIDIVLHVRHGTQYDTVLYMLCSIICVVIDCIMTCTQHMVSVAPVGATMQG